MRNILVIFGGESVEHDISVLTGLITLSAIEKGGDTPIPVYVSKANEWYTGDKLKDVEYYKDFDKKGLKKCCLLPNDNNLYIVKGSKLKRINTISSAINCMHGGIGEDGSIAGLFRVANIPFLSPSHTASGICMDKAMTKIFLKGIGVKRLPCVAISSVNELDVVEKKIPYPIIIKPITLGSSIGIKVAFNRSEAEDGILYALRYDQKVVVEPYVEDFIEINCAVYRDASGVWVSECEKPTKNSQILSFNDKYTCGDREFPAKIDEKIKLKIQNVARKVYLALNSCGIIRIDFMVVKGEVYVLEINAVPGSLSYYLFTDTTAEFSKILKGISNYAISDFAKGKTLVKSFNSSVLNIKGAKGSKHLKKI